MSLFRTAALYLPALAGIVADEKAFAQENDRNGGFDAEASMRIVSAERSRFEADDLDSSGIGGRAEIGYELKSDDTEVRFQVDALGYIYFDDTRETRKGFGGRARVKQALSDDFSATVEGRYAANVITLEAASADQKSVRGELAWESGNNRVTGFVDRRWRSYDDAAHSRGKGLRAGVEYQRRFGSWHWLRLDMTHERNKSADPRRGFERVSAGIDYSRPIAEKLRLRAGLEARRWSYDGRIAQGTTPPTLRKDKLFAPEIGLSYGKAIGLYANARASYEFRASNDVRYKKDGPRFELTLGFRF
ncbi:MAG: hypothetical protein ACRCY3_14620 [Sphingorhabdus sp.]